MLDRDEAPKRIPDLYDELRRREVGALSRPSGWWADYFRDPEDRREGASPRFLALHESAAGEADGFVIYRVKKHWTDDGVAAATRRSTSSTAPPPQCAPRSGGSVLVSTSRPP